MMYCRSRAAAHERHFLSPSAQRGRLRKGYPAGSLSLYILDTCLFVSQTPYLLSSTSLSVGDSVGFRPEPAGLEGGLLGDCLYKHRSARAGAASARVHIMYMFSLVRARSPSAPQQVRTEGTRSSTCSGTPARGPGRDGIE